jgi:NAD(P)-dependent dehydrogenase (short-subunit alcohol dehydrogenase family)
MLSITGKSALVTGSSRGIGRGIAIKLAESGVTKIRVHYFQNRGMAEETAAQLRRRGAEPVLVQADITKPEEIAGMFEAVRASLGTLDILVSNARP